MDLINFMLKRSKNKRWIENIDENSFNECDQLIDSLKKAQENWLRSETYINEIEDDRMIEDWSYQIILNKQIYRYLLRKTKEIVEGARSL